MIWMALAMAATALAVPEPWSFFAVVAEYAALLMAVRWIK